MTDDAPRPRWAQPPLLAFAGLAVVAIPILLSFGRDRWFQYDEWDFLASRELNRPGELFEPHNVHWSTLPILSYRLLWALFGIRSYFPYQVLVVLSHVAVVGLAVVVMRRAGVRPWTATAAGGLLLFLGAGEENILWAFQITFNWSLGFGLLHLLLADHDGDRIDRRDWLGLAAGFAGLLCSGVAVTMVVVVGLAVLVRRGWRLALFHTAPLAVAYGVWFLLVGGDTYGQQKPTSFGDSIELLRDLVVATVEAVSRTSVLGWVLAALLAAGLVVAWRGLAPATRRRRAAAPLALLAGSLCFMVVTAIGRGGTGPDIASNTRYIYVPVVLLMPALVVALDALMKRWFAATAVVVALAVVAVVGNVREFDDDPELAQAFIRNYRDNFVAMAHVPRADEVPRALHPDLGLAPWVTMGWLRLGVEAGRFPDPPSGRDPALETTIEGSLLLRQQPHEPGECEELATPADVVLQAGTSIPVDAPVTIVYTDDAGVESLPLPFAPVSARPAVVSYVDDVAVRIEAAPRATVQLCDPDGGPFEVEGGP